MMVALMSWGRYCLGKALVCKHLGVRLGVLLCRLNTGEGISLVTHNLTYIASLRTAGHHIAQVVEEDREDAIKDRQEQSERGEGLVGSGFSTMRLMAQVNKDSEEQELHLGKHEGYTQEDASHDLGTVVLSWQQHTQRVRGGQT